MRSLHRCERRAKFIASFLPLQVRVQYLHIIDHVFNAFVIRNRLSLLPSLVWFLMAHILEYAPVDSCRFSSPHLWWLTFGILCILYLMVLEIFLLGLLVFILGPVIYVRLIYPFSTISTKGPSADIHSFNIYSWRTASSYFVLVAIPCKTLPSSPK